MEQARESLGFGPARTKRRAEGRRLGVARIHPVLPVPLKQKLPIAVSDRVASSRSDRTVAVACAGLSGSGVGQARESLGFGPARW